MALPTKPGSPKPAAGPRPGQKPWALTDTQRADAERHASAELAEQCDQFEDDLDELRARYELYFLGVERLEPIRRREEMKRRIARMKTAFTRNVGVRFRIETLYARYLAFERLWMRAARQREEGTYRRDIFKARRRGAARSGPAKPPAARKPGEKSEDVDLSDWGAEADETPAPTEEAAPLPDPPPVQTKSPPRQVARQPAGEPSSPSAPPNRTPAGGLSDTQMRSLYDAYISAKKRCNEDVSRLSYEAVSRSVAKQIPEIIQRFKAKAVDFKVVIKDGRAILKASPKT